VITDHPYTPTSQTEFLLVPDAEFAVVELVF